jgi:hypothetical protein
MSLRRAALCLLLLACCGPRNADAAAACQAAGGECFFGFCPDGGARGFAGIDCNPDHNPGGAVCCMK